MKIADIKVGPRFRVGKGDIGALAQSMAKLGQLSPVIVDGTGTLLAGERRILAAISLGWTEIEAVTYARSDSEASRLLVEHDENVCREAFTTAELIRLGKEIKRIEEAAARERRSHGRTAPGRTHGASFPHASKGRSRDLAGDAVGLSGRALDDGIKVIDHVDTLRSKDRVRRADEIEHALNARGVAAALRMLPDRQSREPLPPEPVDDRAIADHILRRVAADLIGVDALLPFEPGDLIQHHEAPQLEQFAQWLGRWRRKPALRVV